MPIHHFLKMNSHSMTNLAVNKNNVSTVMSEVEILSSFARDLRSTAQNFVYTIKSSNSEISAIRFRQILGIAKLHHPESIHHWQSNRIFHLLLLPDQSSMECVHCSSCVQVHLHPIKPLRTAGGTDIQTSK